MKFKVFTKNYKINLKEDSEDKKINLESLIFPACDIMLETSQTADELKENINTVIKKLDDLFSEINGLDKTTTLDNFLAKIDRLSDIVDEAEKNNDTFTGIFQPLKSIIDKILVNLPTNEVQKKKAADGIYNTIKQYITPIKNNLNQIQNALNNFITAFPATKQDSYLSKFNIDKSKKIFTKDDSNLNNLLRSILNFIKKFKPINQQIKNINSKIKLLLAQTQQKDIKADVNFISTITSDNYLEADNIEELIQNIDNLLKENSQTADKESDFIISEITTYIQQVIHKTNVGTGKVYQKLIDALNSGLSYDSDEVKAAWADYLQSTPCKKIHFFGQNTNYLEAIRTALLFEIKFFKSELIEENPFIEYLDKLGIILEANKPDKLNPDYFRNTYNVIHNAVQRGTLTKQDLTNNNSLLGQNNLIFNPELFTYINSKDYLEYQDMLIKLADNDFNDLTSENALAEYKDIYSFIIERLKNNKMSKGEKIKYFMGLPSIQNFLTEYRQLLANNQESKTSPRQILIKKLSPVNKLQSISTIRENLELLMGQANYARQRSAVAYTWKNDNSNNMSNKNNLFHQQLNIIAFNKNIQTLINNKNNSLCAAEINIIMFVLYQYYKQNPSKAKAMQNFEKNIQQVFKNTPLLQPTNLLNVIAKKYSIYLEADIQKIKKLYEDLLKYSYQSWFQQEAEQNKNKNLISLVNIVSNTEVETQNDNKNEK